MISLRFPGTGALGSYRCKNKLSKDYRRFPSLSINEKILIDPSEDLFEFIDSFTLGDIYDGVCDVLITHSHIGHFSICALERLAKRNSIRIYASDALRGEIENIPGAQHVPLRAFCPIQIAGFDVIPCPANHTTDDPKEIVFNFYIRGEKNVFYGLDGAWIHPQTAKLLQTLPCDVFVLDCMLGDAEYDLRAAYHNNFASILAIRDSLRRSGAATAGAKFILSHLPSEKKRSIHEVMGTLTETFTDIKAAYDGYYLGI